MKILTVVNIGRVRASKLIGSTRCGTVSFICAIRAVRISIATPTLKHAISEEGPGGDLPSFTQHEAVVTGIRAVVFVRRVRAVRIAVALERRRHAPARRNTTSAWID